jgi:hypothetical protein
MTKHWKTTGTRDGKPISLYVTTTDEVIAEDIASGQMDSFTLMGRQHAGRQNPTKDSDHLDLAAGAFIGTAHNGGIELRSGSSSGWSISEIEAIPDGLRAHHLGGSGGQFLITVFEQSVA